MKPGDTVWYIDRMTGSIPKIVSGPVKANQDAIVSVDFGPPWGVVAFERSLIFTDHAAALDKLIPLIRKEITARQKATQHAVLALNQAWKARQKLKKVASDASP